MKIKKYIVGAAATATILGGITSLALAENMDTRVLESVSRPKPMVVQIGPEGNTLIRGTINSVGANSLNIKSWGGDWIVNITASTELMPTTDMSQFKVGDFVGVQGQINQNLAWTVDAKILRNWTAKKVEQENREIMRQERRNNEQEIREVIKNESPKNWQGVASNINASNNSITLTIEGTAYTVNVVTDAKIVNQKFLTISFTDIKNGDTVRVWGPVSGTTISAYVVRDISI